MRGYTVHLKDGGEGRNCMTYTHYGTMQRRDTDPPVELQKDHRDLGLTNEAHLSSPHLHKAKRIQMWADLLQQPGSDLIYSP